MQENLGVPLKFLSTPSARRATHDLAGLREVGVFLSTPSARRATHQHSSSGTARNISIHALREEGDRLRVMSRRGT